MKIYKLFLPIRVKNVYFKLYYREGLTIYYKGLQNLFLQEHNNLKNTSFFSIDI